MTNLVGSLPVDWVEVNLDRLISKLGKIDREI